MTNTSILLIEDDDIDAEQVKRNFKKLHLENPIIRATDGLNAIELLRSNDDRITNPIIALLDLNMPRMNGIEFLKEIRQDQKLSMLPVFVLTSSDDKRDIEHTYQYNVQGYFIKPTKPGEFKELLETLCKYLSLIKVPRLELLN